MIHTTVMVVEVMVVVVEIIQIQSLTTIPSSSPLAIVSVNSVECSKNIMYEAKILAPFKGLFLCYQLVFLPYVL